MTEPVEQSVFEKLGGKPLPNARYELFAQGVIAGKPKYKAWLDAGFNAKNRHVAGVCAQQTLRRPDVFNRIQFLLGRRADVTAAESGITKAWVIEMLRENVEKAMGSIEVDEQGKVIDEHTYEGAVVNAALKMLGQEAGAMFRERLEHTGKDGDPIEMRAQVTVYLPSNGRDLPPTG